MYNNNEIIIINDEKKKNVSLYTCNINVKKIAKIEIKKRKEKVFLLSITITMISNKIFKTNKISSNMTKKHIFKKISTRLTFKNIDKNLSVEMKYKYSQYKKNVVFVEVRIANEVIVVKKNNFKKKKTMHLSKQLLLN